MILMRTISMISSASLLMALSAFSSAQPEAKAPAPFAAPAPIDEADAHYFKGKALFQAGKTADALEEDKKAWALKQTFDIATNLAQVELELHKTPDAVTHLRFAASHFPPSLDQEKRDFVAGKLAELRKVVGRLRIRPSSANAAVSLDGSPLRPEDLADEIFVTPGTHVVEAKLDGYEDAHKNVVVAANAVEAADLTLVSHHVAPPIPAQPTKNEAKPVLLGLSIGVGALGLGMGIVGTLMANSKGSDADATLATIKSGRGSCPAAAECSDLRSSLASRDKLQGLGATGFAIASVGALAAVSVLAFVPSVSTARTTVSGMRGVDVVVSASGASVRGRF